VVTVNVHVIGSTRRPLGPLVSKGLWRFDLFQDFDLCAVMIPPLRTWGDDLPRWAEWVFANLKKIYCAPEKSIHAEGFRHLSRYSWPGNLRELTKELTRGLLFDPGDSLRFEHLHPADSHTRPNGI